MTAGIVHDISKAGFGFHGRDRARDAVASNSIVVAVMRVPAAGSAPRATVLISESLPDLQDCELRIAVKELSVERNRAGTHDQARAEKRYQRHIRAGECMAGLHGGEKRQTIASGVTK